jgi:hypothetical protein
MIGLTTKVEPVIDCTPSVSNSKVFARRAAPMRPLSIVMPEPSAGATELNST